MRAKPLLVLALVAAAAVAGAAYTVADRNQGVLQQASGESFFPGLLARINEVSAVVVRKAGQRWSLRRGEEGWTMPEKGGYAASADKVKAAVVALAELRILEAKTEKPERYAKIDVEDVGAEGSKAVLVELQDAGGQVMAALLVGKTRRFASASKPAEVYVRRPGEARAWLVEGRLAIEGEPLKWLEKKALQIDKSRVSKVLVRHPDGEVVTLDRVGDEGDRFKLAAVPEGRKVASEYRLGAMAGVMQYFAFEDVARATDVALGEEATRTTFETRDGLRVGFRINAVGDRYWARIAAESDEALAADDAESEAAQKEAKEINGRVAGWAYLLSESRAEDLMRRMKDLTEAEEPSGDS